MRFALLTELYPPSIGGQELFFAGLASALAARGHDVDVFCIGHAHGLRPVETIEGIRVHRHPIAPGYTTPPHAWMRRRWSAILRYALWTRRELGTASFDAIVLNQWPLLHAALLPRALRQRAVLHWCEVRSDPFHAILQRLLPRAVALNAGVSDTVATAIERTSERPVFVLPGGLDIARYGEGTPLPRQNILALGRIAPHKNLERLIDAFEQLRARGYAGRLKIAGDGPAMGALRERAAHSPVGHAIDILGAVDEAAKLNLLASSALMMITSRREGFPRVVAEAMASGLPVVTSDDPGNGTRDIVAAAGCGLVAPAEPAALALAAEQILAAPEGFADAGRRYAAALDWSEIAAALERRLGATPP
jgi:glycosyltransferase involved in cell wall biosynthesis